MTVYRVWMLVHQSDQAVWLPVSVAFARHDDASRWAEYLNTDDYEIREEKRDKDWP
jgi:hypothetical protein